MAAPAQAVDRFESSLDGILRVRNFYWSGSVFRPLIEPDTGRAWLSTLGTLRGQFALVLAEKRARRISLVRDPLGTNKLFFAIHRSGRIAVANYLVDLVKRDVPCEAAYSVPPGCVVQIDLQRQALARFRYVSVGRGGGPRPVHDLARTIRGQLDTWFARLAGQFRDRQVFVCLSGGVDSGLIAGFARKHFPHLTAYTYTFDNASGVSEDAAAARRLADALGIPFRLVWASAQDVLDVLVTALTSGQDWRDFNVHCAIVNELLARAMKQDLAESRDPGAALVLTAPVPSDARARIAAALR